MGLKFVRRASFATTDVWESDASQNNSAQNDLGFRLALFGNSAGPQSKLQELTWRIGFSDLPNNPTNHENATWCLNMRQSGTSMCPVFEDVVPWSRLCCFEAPHSFVLDYIHT